MVIQSASADQWSWQGVNADEEDAGRASYKIRARFSLRKQSLRSQACPARFR